VTLTAALVVCATAVQLAAVGPLATGTAFHYRAGTFREVAANRGIALRSDVLGYASVPDCSHIGQLVLARVGREVGWWQVLDCSHPRDLPMQRARGLVIEVNYDAAERGGWAWRYDEGRGVGRTSAAIYAYREVGQ
jgi:hypothetical protein